MCAEKRAHHLITLLFVFRAYTDNPYCTSGFTYGFWIRVTQFDNQASSFGYIINQGQYTSGGLNIYFGKTLGMYLELPDTVFYCGMSEFRELYHQQWNFLALTYDTVSKKAYCIFNDMKYGEFTSTPSTQQITNPFTFGGPVPFFIDDVVYVPKFCTEPMMHAIYNKSKYQTAL